MLTRANQIELHTNINQKTNTNVVTSANFGASKIVINDIDNTNVIVIALSNTLLKKTNVNKITIIYSNAALIRLDTYVTTIK